MISKAQNAQNGDRGSARTALYSLEAEMGLLGAILIDNRAHGEVTHFLRAEHFADRAHATIYAVLDGIIRSGGIADHVIARARLEGDERLAHVGGAAYIARLAANAITTINAPWYGREIRRLAERRALAEIGEDLSDVYVSDNDRPTREIISDLQARLGEIAEPTGDGAGVLAGTGLDFAVLATKHPPPRRFAWQPWIPARTTTLLHGYGGVGKTLISQMICTAYGLGLDLFAGPTEGRPALLIAGEDDHDELWRRQVDICRRLGVDLADLAGRVRIHAVPHVDITIAEASASGAIAVMPMFATLRAEIQALKPGLVALDNASKIFALSENDRIAVTRGIGMLNGIAHDFDASVLLIAHNNKGGDFSGSTAWENVCRARLSLTGDKEAGTVTLARPKANYSSDGEIVLKWDDGSFRCETPEAMTAAERVAADVERRAHAEAFLAALDKLTDQGRPVSHSERAVNFAPKIMLEAGVAQDLTRQQLIDAMNLLLKEGRIRANAEIGRRSNRAPICGLARAL